MARSRFHRRKVIKHLHDDAARGSAVHLEIQEDVRLSLWR